MQQQKRIIIGLPTAIDFYRIIGNLLTEKGFEVIDISYGDHDFKYKRFSDRAYNFFRKTFLNDRHYKNKLKFRFAEEKIKTQLAQIEGKVDYCLLIRADIYPRHIIELIKEKTQKLIGYQWDGLNRFKAIKDYIPLFDRFFVFDGKDLCKGLLPLTNFYFKSVALNVKKETQPNKEAFFLGSYEKSRMETIISFYHWLTALHYTPRFHIFLPEGKQVPHNEYKYINFFSERISYEKYLEEMAKAEILIDFLNHTHTGLSFRAFEALGYDKKLITDNKTITQYDFYHADNIFILNENTQEELKSFLKTPYRPVPEHIKEKYSFDNWIKYVLDEPPYKNIDLPDSL